MLLKAGWMVLQSIQKKLLQGLDKIKEQAPDYAIDDRDMKVTWFVYDDLDLNLETLYVSCSNKFNKDFLLDVIKVVSFI